MSSVDDETILEVLRTGDDPRMTTTEIAGQLPVTRGTTRTRLQTLADDGLVTREREGRNVVWWLPERADEVSGASAPDASGDAASEEVPATTDADDADEPEASESTDESGGEDPDGTAADADAEGVDEEGADDDDTDARDVEVEPVEPSTSEREEGVDVEVETPGDADADEEGEEPDVTTPDRETETRTEPLPEAPQDDRTVQAVLALVALAVLYAFVRRLRR